MILRTESDWLMHRAVAAEMQKGRVLYHGGRFWHVLASWCEDDEWYCFDLTPARRSIDDCTPAEWTDAGASYYSKTY